MADNEITCPDDLPAPIDFDAPARRADLDNDARLTCAFNHQPISRAQLDAEIDRCSGFRLGVRQALS